MKAIKLLVLSVLAMLPCEAALLAGSEPKEWPADPSRHVVSVERVFQNESEAALITAAEHFAPNEKELAAEAQKQDPAAKLVAKQWWYQESLGVKIPFTLTAEAVLYYSELVHGFGKQKLVRYTSPVSRFSYKASVSKRDSIEHGGVTFTKVTVVTLTMSFSEHFVTTMTEGMDFTKVREVVFDADGKVLFTRGDGATEVPIMAI